MNAKLLDFDANLLHEDLVVDMERHITTAQGKGVGTFVIPGSTLEDSALGLALARERPSVVLATAGIHPFRASQIEYNPGTLAALEALVTDPHCLAVGECGLDYSPGFPPAEAQLPWFRAHVRLALTHALPLYVHVRDAHDDFIVAMDDEMPVTGGSEGPPSVSVCVHCFTGTTAELDVYCQRGYYVSLSGHVLRMRSKPDSPDLADWLRLIPPDRLLIETDAPYMGFKGCRTSEAAKKTQNYPNVPAALPLVLQALVDAGGGSYDELALRTTANALRFFKQ